MAEDQNSNAVTVIGDDEIKIEHEGNAYTLTISGNDSFFGDKDYGFEIKGPNGKLLTRADLADSVGAQAALGAIKAHQAEISGAMVEVTGNRTQNVDGNSNDEVVLNNLETVRDGSVSYKDEIGALGQVVDAMATRAIFTAARELDTYTLVGNRNNRHFENSEGETITSVKGMVRADRLEEFLSSEDGATTNANAVLASVGLSTEIDGTQSPVMVADAEESTPKTETPETETPETGEPTETELAATPATPTAPRMERNSDVGAIQLIALAVKAGGQDFGNKPISEHDDIRGPKTEHSMSVMLGKEVNELGSTADELAALEAKMKDNPEFMATVVAGISKMDEAQALAFLEDRGADVSGGLQAALAAYSGEEAPVTQVANADDAASEDKPDVETVASTDQRATPDPYAIRAQNHPNALRPQFATANWEAATRPDYSGIVWDDEKIKVDIRSNGSAAIILPTNLSDEERDQIIDSRRDRGGKATFTIAKQTDGIDLKKPTADDKDWAQGVKDDPEAASRGILELGSGGKLYLTRINDEGELTRANITEYVRDNGIESIGLQHVAFRLDSENAQSITNGFAQARNLGAFDPQTGMVMNVEGNIFGFGNDAHYDLRVYADANGDTQIRFVGESENQAAMLAQTPEDIQNLDNSFHKMDDAGSVMKSITEQLAKQEEIETNDLQNPISRPLPPGYTVV